jgi:hypothetical protein
VERARLQAAARGAGPPDARCGPVELHVTARHASFRKRSPAAAPTWASACCTRSRQRCGTTPGDRHRRRLPGAAAADLRRAHRLRGACEVVLAPAEMAATP